MVVGSDMHLEPEKEKRVILHNFFFFKTNDAFCLFLDEFPKFDPEAISCSLTTEWTAQLVTDY